MHGDRRGTTLVELMAVLACIAILGAIVLPEWIAKDWPAYRLKNAARQVVSDMRHARMRAVSTDRPYRLRFDPMSDSYRLESGNLSGGALVWVPEGSRQCFGIQGGTSFLGVSIIGERPYTAVFRPTGGVSPATVSLQNSLGRSIRVVCSMAGRIRMEREE